MFEKVIKETFKPVKSDEKNIESKKVVEGISEELVNKESVEETIKEETSTKATPPEEIGEIKSPFGPKGSLRNFK